MAGRESNTPPRKGQTLAATMQLNEGPLNRRDAKTAEKGQSQPVEGLSLNGEWVEGRYPRSFLSALRVSAVPWHTPSLNRYGSDWSSARARRASWDWKSGPAKVHYL